MKQPLLCHLLSMKFQISEMMVRLLLMYPLYLQRKLTYNYMLSIFILYTASVRVKTKRVSRTKNQKSKHCLVIIVLKQSVSNTYIVHYITHQQSMLMQDQWHLYIVVSMHLSLQNLVCTHYVRLVT